MAIGTQNIPPAATPRWKPALLLGSTVVGLIAAILAPRIPQEPGYHHFADREIWLGIANFWNVVSNLPFLLVGWAGLRALRDARPEGIQPELRAAYGVFFCGIGLIAPGSAYYHLAPNNDSLVWDRLPMAIAFGAFFALVIGERVSLVLGRRLLWPMVIAGAGSVAYWWVTEQNGAGDLRPYALVQFLPMVLIPLTLLLYPGDRDRTRVVWGLMGLYGLAKLAEFFDAAIFEWLQPVSGHAIKHLLSAAAVYCLVLAIRRGEGPMRRQDG